MMRRTGRGNSSSHDSSSETFFSVNISSNSVFLDAHHSFYAPQVDALSERLREKLQQESSFYGSNFQKGIFSQAFDMYCNSRLMQQQQQQEFSGSEKQVKAGKNDEIQWRKMAFFIMENSGHEELDSEEDKIKEKLLYFWPSHIHEHDMLNYVGYVFGSTRVFEKLEGNPSDMTELFIEYSDVKSLWKLVDNIYLVISSPADIPNDCLKQQMDSIYGAIVFFNGPIDHIQQKFTVRLEYEEKIKQIGDFLTCLFISYTQFPSSLMNPIHYSELPPKNNSLFITASQLLDQLSDQIPDYLGGCILCENATVLCNQIDERVLPWIIYKVQKLSNVNTVSNSEQQQQQQQQQQHYHPSAIPIPSPSSGEHIAGSFDNYSVSSSSSSIYLGAMSGSDQDSHGSNNKISSLSPLSLSSPGHQYNQFNYQQQQQYAQIQQQLRQQIPVLQKHYTSSTHEIDFSAVFIPSETISDMREEFNPNMDNTCNTPPKQKKDKKKLSAFGPNIDFGNQQHKGEYVALVIFQVNHISLAIVAGISKIDTIERDIMDILLKQKSTMYSISQGAMNIIQNGTEYNRTDQQASYALLHNSSNHSISGNSSSKRFIEQCNIALGQFQRNATTHKIMLKDNAGFLYSKSMLGSLVFYHQTFGTSASVLNTQSSQSSNTKITTANEVQLERAESNAKQQLRQHFKINLP